MQVKVTSTKRASRRDPSSRLAAIRQDAHAFLEQSHKRNARSSFPTSAFLDFQEMARPQLAGPQFEYQKVE